MTADRDHPAAEQTTRDSAAGLPALRAILSRARSRWIVNALLGGCTLSLLVGLALFCAFHAAALVFDADTMTRFLPRLFAAPTLDHVAKSIAVFSATFGIAALVALMRAPDPAAHARAADRKFALKERLSTALEVASTGTAGTATQGPVHQALLADAERCARSVDARTLIPVGLPRAAWGVLPLVALAIVLEVMPTSAFRNTAPAATIARNSAEDGGLSHQEATDSAANLRRIAEILEQDATQRSDPYLRTLARTLDRLSADVAAARIDKPRLTSELNQLLSHMQQAYAQNDGAGNAGAPRPSATELLRSALNEITGNRTASDTSARDAAPIEAKAAESKPPVKQSQMSERRANNPVMLNEQAAALLQRLGLDPSWVLVDEDGNEVDPRSQIERLLAEEERRARGGGQPAGAAANAGQGDGDQAGDGVHPLGRGNAKSPDPAATEQMLLPDPTGRAGSHIRIEIPPGAELSEVAAPTSDAADRWRRMQEQPVDRLFVEAERRQILGRYFKRSTSSGSANETGPQGRRP